ncbi:uncharacterized protein LOC129457107 [Periophthalmus magnuspinnatus]|uniref:uncharacterized protein LOC129457107 n=1 Tax=Periophthalmus magnuspinnatus TaxID=409849 RepID=UPI002437086C|nr:uncharacterized protein LOC129457107 [Periophthalmus magnuspinnatus]
MIPQELFYTDPTMMCGTRIPNHVNELKDFDCFHLHTPPPIMSACPAPPNGSDPFRTERRLVRNLGCSFWETGPLPPPVGRTWVVLQLTPEEDQTITNLLKLHHGEGAEEDGDFYMDREFSPDQRREQIHRCFTRSEEAGLGKQTKRWSDRELEAANTLLTQFGATREDDDDDVKSDGWDDSKASGVFGFNDRALSRSEGEAVCGLLNLGLLQT